MKPRVELLAPAGSVESMVAAINAGADAVYMGGSRFGARAYADNPEEDSLLWAIDYAHLHGCKLYLTANTLVKEGELGQLFDFLLPYYRQGLDAAIVQDMGVFALIREKFPDLPVHASTQMTVTGYRLAKKLKAMGATRVVPARELSLKEIARIRQQADIEIETFVHGALCYCYSGQCLLSSLIGGRSGNRGRCAQPCRLPYGAGGAGQKPTGLLSMKDLCTLDILPDIVESGVYSLKIEGRMKSPRYTAGVVSIYRKYLNLYLEKGRGGYHVLAQDRDVLLKLFDRGGFTEGYYQKHNGRDMVVLGGKPSFREADQALLERLDQEYVDRKKQEPINGKLAVREGEPASLWLEGGGTQATVFGDLVQTAKNQPMTGEKLFRQLNKTGNSPFYFRQLETELSGNCFLPVQSLNQLRRRGMEQLEQSILMPYRRRCLPVPQEGPSLFSSTKEGRPGGRNAPGRAGAKEGEGEGERPRFHVSLEGPEGLEAVALHPDVALACIDSCGFPAEKWAWAVRVCHKAGKKCALALPYIFRTKAEQYFLDHLTCLKDAGFDELLLRSLEEGEFLREHGVEVPWVLDANLYAMNHLAASALSDKGVLRLTLPLELNARELAELNLWPAGSQGWEAVVYGYLPAMVTAQCIQRTTGKCTEGPGVLYITDRAKKRLPVKNHCRFCYNIIYNPEPLSLLGQGHLVEKLEAAALRLQFTIETPQQIQAVLDAYAGCFYHGKEAPDLFAAFTRGHWKRGVE
ncbi:MAG: U32 family peptidase [Lachnospiraceae bacterium]|nr:U32 family peptidase [Lachnospiraceae bacterium]